MSDLMSVASAGVHSAVARFDSSVVEAVKAARPGSKDDLPAAMVAVTTNSLAVKANLQVLKTADKTMGTLLDVMT